METKLVQSNVSHVIGFPLVSEDGKQSVLVRLTEGTYQAGTTLVLKHDSLERKGGFMTIFSSQAYSSCDAVLASQQRTLVATFAGVTTGTSSELVKLLMAESTGIQIHGTSASLALYFCCLAEKLPVVNSESVSCYWYVTGAITFGANPDWGKPLLPNLVAAKKAAIDRMHDVPNQFLVLLDRDASKLSCSSQAMDSLDAPFPTRNRLDTATNVVSISTDSKGTVQAALEAFAKVTGTTLRTSENDPSGVDNLKLPDRDPPVGDTFGTLIKRALKTYADAYVNTAVAANAFIDGIPKSDPSSDFNRSLVKFELQRNALDETKLQQDIPLPKLLWDTEKEYDRRHVLIAGPTGCGKTALVDALVLRAILGQEGMALYIAPTRALAGEFHRNFLRRYKALLEASCPGKTIEDEIVLSTGEHYTHDRKIREAAVSLACVVTEKANVLCAATEAGLLDTDSRLRLVVFDELHMLAETGRGGVLDALIAKMKYSATKRAAYAPLRLCGLTTEGIVKQLEESRAFHADDYKSRIGEPSKFPVLLETTVRPVPVQHFVRLLFSEQAVPVCAFENTADRFLNARPGAAIASRLAEYARKLPTTRTDGARAIFCADAIFDAITGGAKTVILAIGSTDELFGIADHLKGKLSGIGAENPEDIALFEKAELDKNTRTRLKEYAKKGIYLHNADMSFDLREHVETGFQKLPEEGASKVLLTTETLSYGVNLCADVVILAGTSFPREHRYDSGFAGVDHSVPLSPNAYHNLLGRTGRFGAVGESIDCKAFVFLDGLTAKRNAKSQTDFTSEFVTRYYSDRISAQGMSALFFPRDDTLRKMSECAAIVSANAPPISVAAVSHNAFRSVCDAVRFLAREEENATATNVTDFLLTWSIYGAVEAGKHLDDPAVPNGDRKLREREGTSRLVKGLLIDLERLGFVRSAGGEAENKKWSLSEKGSALIDTGIKPSAIGAIQMLLKQSTVATLPVELIVIAFCATPEFWNLAAMDLCQAMHLKDSQGKSEEYLAHAREKLQSRLTDRLKLDVDVVKAVMSVADKLFADTVAQDSTPPLYFRSTSKDVDISKVAFYTLCAIVIGWVTNESDESLLKLYFVEKGADGKPSQSGVAQQKRPRSFKNSLSEKLGWLASATAKFFYEGELKPERKAEVIELIDRLRFGIEPVQVAFMQPGASGTAKPNRTELRAFTAGKSHSNLVDIVFGEPVEPETLVWRQRARRFFAHEMDTFQQLGSRNAKIAADGTWKKMVEALGKAIRNESQLPFEEIDSWLDKVEPSMTRSPRDGTAKWLLIDQLCLSWGPQLPGALDSLPALTLDARALHFDSVQKTGSIFLVIGFVCLHARDLLISDWRVKFLTLGNTGQLTFRKLVLDCCDLGKLAETADLAEQLLAFREPGW